MTIRYGIDARHALRKRNFWKEKDMVPALAENLRARREKIYFQHPEKARNYIKYMRNALPGLKGDYFPEALRTLSALL